MNANFKIKMEFTELEELLVDNEGLLTKKSGERVSATKVGSGELVFYPGELLPEELERIPENANAFLLGKTREETKIISELPGISRHYTTYYTKIDYYQT